MPRVLDQVRAQDTALATLRRALRAGRVHHALLFDGPSGVGKELTAFGLAQALVCEKPVEGEACGVCSACARSLLREGEKRPVHPDVVVLERGLYEPAQIGRRTPENQDLSIDQIRTLVLARAAYAPHEGRAKVFIIRRAEELNASAANALLKTLEEPPGHTVFALVTTAPEALLETIISRCRRIDVRPVPRAEIEAGLVARGIEPGLAARASEASRGKPGRAIQFAEQPDLMGDRARLLSRCAGVASDGTGGRFRYAGDLAERYRKDRAAVLIEIDTWEAFWEERLRHGASEGASNEALAGFVEALTAIRQAREDLQTNVISRTAFELMLLSFPRVTLAASPEEEPVAHA